MQIQKPTVLDAARIREELKGFVNIDIDCAFSGFSGKQLYIKFRKSDSILKYHVDKTISYLGIAGRMPDNPEKSLPGIEGFSFSEIRQINNDRILEIILLKKDRLGKTLKARLIFELMPNIGDVFFIGDDFNIKSTLRKRRKMTYEYPRPPGKPTVLKINEGQLKNIMEAGGDLFEKIYGLNTRDILNLSIGDKFEVDELFHDLNQFVIEAKKPGPAWIIARDDEYIGFSLVRPRLLPNEIALEYESALEMYEQFYGATAGSIEEKERIESLLKIVMSQTIKLRRKASRIKRELEESKKAELYKTYGELILANINNIDKGADSISLKPFDSESNDKIIIKLDPAKSLAANAKDYFKKSRKAAGSKEILNSRLGEAERLITRLENIKLSSADRPKELERLLIEMGLLTGKPGAATKKPIEKRKPYKTYRASCGWDILIGKSNRDNDELTFHIASKEDFWFHAWQAAGSHTVLRLPDKSSKPDKQTLLEAASLAAYHSRAKHSSKVPVVYTQVKYVRKPRKFPPGKVLVEREKQLMVKPADPDRFLPAEEQN